MKPWIHAENSAKRFGGVAEDYIVIHDFFDSSKAVFPDMRHRALYHHSHGIYLSERLFGHNVRNRDNQLVSVRDVGEWHCIEDLGRIPTVQDYLEQMPFYNWLGGTKKKKRITSVDEMVSEIQETNTTFQEWFRAGEQVVPSATYNFKAPPWGNNFMDTAATRQTRKAGQKDTVID